MKIWKQNRIVINNFTKFLTNRDSINCSDEKITEFLGNEVKSITKETGYNKTEYGIRLITFNGATSVISRNIKAWTFIQWWNKDDISSQALFEGSDIRINNFCTIPYNGRLVILMVGLSGKNPTAQSWAFGGDTWSPLNTLNEQRIVKRNGWEYTIDSSSIIIEKRKKDNNEEWLIPTVKINQNGTGFNLDSKVENIREEFIFKDGTFCN